MKTHVYSEAGIRGRREFALAGRNLTITGKRGFGDFRLEVDLADIAPNFERVKCFDHGALRRASIYLIVVAAVALLLSRQPLVSPVIIGVVALLLAWPGITVLFRFSRLIEVEQFRSRTAGVVVFDLIREKKKGPEFDRFVEEIRSAVVNAKRDDGPNQALQPTPMLVTPRADARVAPSTGVADL